VVHIGRFIIIRQKWSVFSTLNLALAHLFVKVPRPGDSEGTFLVTEPDSAVSAFKASSATL